MYSQVYYHPVRRAYDVHLGDFMVAWLGENGLSTDLKEYLSFTDNEVLVELRKAADDSSHPGHDPADRIVNRKHFHILYERNPNDSRKNSEAGAAVYEAACGKFGETVVRHDRYTQKGSGNEFPVKNRDGSISSSYAVSDVLRTVPLVNIDYVFVAPAVLPEASTWLREEIDQIIVPVKEEEQ
jgi:HD superfamily phosphohydrolase